MAKSTDGVKGAGKEEEKLGNGEGERLDGELRRTQDDTSNRVPP